jgi:hypothetical protein
MARVAVLCVLFAFLAVAAFGQTCEGPTTVPYATVLSATGSVVVDATAVANLKGSIVFKYGSGDVTVDFQKNQGWKAVPASGLITVTRTIVDGANGLSSSNLLVTLALAVVALVSQRGSLATLAIVLAIATVAIAACPTPENLELVINVNQATLSSFEIKVKADASTKLCPAAITVDFDTARMDVTKTVVGTDCSIKYTNPLYGCDNACGSSKTGVAKTSCVNKVCVLDCNGGVKNCDGLPGNGCEQDLSAIDNCGDCKVDCSSVLNVSPASSCDVSGTTYKCSFDENNCAPGWSNCDNDGTNGCEAATGNDVDNCGGCGVECKGLPGVNPAATFECKNSICSSTSDFCLDNKLDCKTGSNDGCETDKGAIDNCGVCFNDCSDGVNVKSSSCNATTFECDIVCQDDTDDCTTEPGCETDVSSDVNGCGGCSIDCNKFDFVDPTKTTCVSGECIIGCIDGFKDCDGVAENGCETDVSGDVDNCGDCKASCSSLPNIGGLTCVGGVCEGTCEDGFDQCDPSLDTSDVGCPTNLKTTVTDCNGCGNDCAAVVNAIKKCADGVCGYESCNNNFGDCNLKTTDGCEVDLTVNKNNCKTCGLDCVSKVQNADAICKSSTCDYNTCSGTFKDCDNDRTNGCEINTALTTTQCGACSGLNPTGGYSVDCTTVVKNASPICQSSLCDYSSCNAANFKDCDGKRENGCEINTDNDPINCGGCGPAAPQNCKELPNVNVGSIQCSAGKCNTAAAGACAVNYNDCDGIYQNGCELKNDICDKGEVGCSKAMKYDTPYDCAELLKDAKYNVVASVCDSKAGDNLGKCFVNCTEGWSDCDLDITTGCETKSDACGSELTTGVCQTALQDPLGFANCLALANDPAINFTVKQASGLNVCKNLDGLCNYECETNFYDCDVSATNGCEIDKRRCPMNSADDCIFNNDTRCGYGKCVNCLTLSGSIPGTSTCVTNVNGSQCTVDSCNATLCIDRDGDWSNGCESAQGYIGAKLGEVDCSKDIDLTNVEFYGPILCVGDSDLQLAGRCDFTCKEGFADCDLSPFNGCETQVNAACDSCVFMADVQCGKNKCVDCTLLEGTLLSEYANGRFATASASTCLPVNATVNPRVTDYTCDTSVHYLNPRFDAPNGHNGACQSELCRDLDGDWTNGCESAQQYGRGRFYYYGDEFNTDSYLVPYVPNPYQARFYEYKEEFLRRDVQNNLVFELQQDIKALSSLFLGIFSQAGFNNLTEDYEWDDVAGYIYGEDGWFGYNYPQYYEYLYADSGQYGYYPGTYGFVSSREVVLLHYTVEWPELIDEPAEAAAQVLIPQPYLTPRDCELSEWSDWGLCTYEDDCIVFDYFLQTKIRTREVVKAAHGGGVCHLPLVEDFYRFSHRQGGQGNDIRYNSNTGFESVWQNFGNDHQHGGGIGVRVDYTGKSYTGNVFDIKSVLLWNPSEWNVTGTWSEEILYNGANDARALAWTGNEYRNQSDGNETQRNNAYQYGRLLTCAPKNSCPATNTIPPRSCDISAWSEWSKCSADCDGDWAGGVRIRTRTVFSGAASFGECFRTEFDEETGEALVENAGMLYEEDWQCNDHSCSSFNCLSLRTLSFAEDHHIYLGADAVKPKCDGLDWSEYVNGAAFIDFNRDGSDDNSLYESGKHEPYQGNFPLFFTIYNFSYTYQWPGHCLYECEEGWFDCDHDPRNGCETDGDFCSIDAEFDSLTQLTHPTLPWEHPHGECTVSWNNSTAYRDCTDYNNQDPALTFTTGLCQYWNKTDTETFGKCDLSCQYGYTNCFGDGCIPVAPFSADENDYELRYCGSQCIDCGQLNRFQYGSSSLWICSNDYSSDYTCTSQGCMAGCKDLDGDVFNGCETATYQQLPYPDVEPFSVEYDGWSSWTQCSHADQCGFLWDINDGVGVFRNVPIQTRYRRPIKSAYNGGFYDEFSYVGRSSLYIDGYSFPPEADFDVTNGRLGLTPPLARILNVPLVQTPFYEVKVCSSIPAPCIECTNQLEGLEVHCVLSQWSKWSACSAECTDRIADPRYYNNDDLLDPKIDEFNPRDYDLSNYWVVDRQPYQIRTRAVTSGARLGGRCPPPGDTWQVTEAASHVFLHYETDGSPFDGVDLADGGLLDDFNSNSLMSAKASYLVDIRKCNSELCSYPEDCDALNYYFPGHFKAISTCVTDTETHSGSALLSRCGNNDRYSVDGNSFFCNENNGYCSDSNEDIRDGCDSFVYPTACGRTDGDFDQCDYSSFRDCTTLPGVVTPFAAPCVNEEQPEVFYDHSQKRAVSDHDTHYHKCDIRWSCDPRLCSNENYHYDWDYAVDDWKDGCEVARYYQYPFVTVRSNFLYDPEAVVRGNPISLFYEFAIYVNNSYDQEDIEAYTNYVTFADNLTLYTLNSTTNSKLFNIDCQALLWGWSKTLSAGKAKSVKTTYCAYDGAIEPIYPDGYLFSYPYGGVSGFYSLDEGCHLIGDAYENEYYDLGFGCNGVWGTPNAGTCTMKCAAGYVDADLDPRNGCETDLFEYATPEDRFAWAGNCKTPLSIVTPASCGADLCIDCRTLPGLNIPSGTIGSQTPNCTLVEEWVGRIPVLNEDDYFSIQYACGVATGNPAYQGKVDFRDTYCPTSRLCFDADGDWTNGCEQGRGYARGINGKYSMGAAYDDIFDYINFVPSDLEWPTDRSAIEDTTDDGPNRCDLNFIQSSPSPNYYNWYLENDVTCDKRSSGFEFPVPGASFFMDIRGVLDATQDPDNLATLTLPVLELEQWLSKMDDLNDILDEVANIAYPPKPLVETLNNRAFDCSLPFSTEQLYDLGSDGVPIYKGRDEDGDGRGHFTFGQVFHINTAVYLNGTTTVCNTVDGFCQYVCQANWADFDLDPSNGCEADLLGPCGVAQKKYPALLLLKNKGTYQSVNSCGADCVDCTNLPGAYNAPLFMSQCVAAHPSNFHYNQEKGDYVLGTSRFVYACSTESVQSDENHTTGAWKAVICDPRKCFDANFDYLDGCELATNYPQSWALGNMSKSSYKHWFSPITEANGKHLPETTYWVREDGVLAIGRAPYAPIDVTNSSRWPTGLPDNWAPVFNFLNTGDFDEEFNPLNEYVDLDDEIVSVDSFWFSEWNVTRDAPGYIEYNWQSSSLSGYDAFPFKGVKSAYDCSNAYVASGYSEVYINSEDYIYVAWQFTPEHKGPWYHVNQSKVSACTAGYNPAESQKNFQDFGNIIMSKYCSQTAGLGETAADLKCYLSWKFPGEGRCKLACENGWADGDADPTNGCETFLANEKPNPTSQCGANYLVGTVYQDPALAVDITEAVRINNFNFNQLGSCGAGVCVSCLTLGGVSKLAIGSTFNLTNDPTGMKPYCVDGGDSWEEADFNTTLLGAPQPVYAGNPYRSSAVYYPGDYYCTGIINQNSCRRLQLKYSCATLGNKALCPEGSFYPHAEEGRYEILQANARFVQVCEDRDGLWENGCEYALGYNLGLTTNATIVYTVTSNDGTALLYGQYDRTIGVKPYWDSNFTVIDWANIDGEDTWTSDAGFDCEIVRKLPHAHTHVKVETLTENKIECSAKGRGDFEGTCSFECESGWNDCDLNPWNGCEQFKPLCGGIASVGTSGCNTAQAYFQNGAPKTLLCSGAGTPIKESTLERDSFCDGNQIPFDDWYSWYNEDEEDLNSDDAVYYAGQFEIYDHGHDYVDVKVNYVAPKVSRYTIKGYWDNVDIDYSCRIWNNISLLPAFTLRNLDTIPSDANRATGKCAVDCLEAGGYSDCDGNPLNGCDNHKIQQLCRTTSGTCMSCIDLPGIRSPLISQCLAVNKVTQKNFNTIAFTWDVGFEGIESVYSFTYGSVNPISAEFPQCDTRTELQVADDSHACDSSYCRDYDQDWENGCEFPMGYGSRAEWETPQATYGQFGVIYDGFDCSWISDPQPDAGGRNYGGQTWAKKFHVNLTRGRGSCIGNPLADNAGTCNVDQICEDFWRDCDGDPTNGCENSEELCGDCVLAKGYPGTLETVNCSTLNDVSKGFVNFLDEFGNPKLPECNGREGQNGQCSYYFCNIFNNNCDSGISDILADQGCINLTTSANREYCGADWNWRDIRGNESTVPYYHNIFTGDRDARPEYLEGRMLDYSNFDGTGRCATCTDLNGYSSEDAFCKKDPVIAGHTFDRITYYKPLASGFIDNGLGSVEFITAGNTVGDYLCQLHGEMGVDDDGACDRRYCVDEDYFWANGCETAVRYSFDDIIGYGTSDYQRDDHGDDWTTFGFDYHFAYNDDIFGTVWPYSQVLAVDNLTAINSVQSSYSYRSNIRGIWCPFLQFWSLATDNYFTGDCDVFPCPHLAPSTVDTWITCVSNVTAENAGKCNFVCNVEDGWQDCDLDPMTGCETDIFNDGTCGSGCDRVECNSIDGLNPWYWSECLATTDINGVTTSACDLSICNESLCQNLDDDWTNGCETAVNYEGEGPFNCTKLDLAFMHFAKVSPCNGESGNHWAGKCEFECEPGWIDCDGLFFNGCEDDGSLCQDCKLALGYVTYFDGADWWEYWGPAVNTAGKDDFFKVVYGSRFIQSTTRYSNYRLVYDEFEDEREILHDQYDGPEVVYAQFHRAYVASFDCTTLATTYPGHFKNTVLLQCDNNDTHVTAGLCTYECDETKGYFDCDGDPRNGCEHESLHEACGKGGACRNCYYLSGLDYPVDTDGDGDNDGSMGPYITGAFGNYTSDDNNPDDVGVRDYSDVYHERNVTYFSRNEPTLSPAVSSLLNKDFPDPATSPLRLGCVLNGDVFACNLDTCIIAADSRCRDGDQGTLQSDSWLNGCERAQAYDFNGDGTNDTFDCSSMGPDPTKGDQPRITTDHTKPSFHVRQVVGTVGCDRHEVKIAGSPYLGKGAWRYILARSLRSDSETEGDYAFDFEGLDNYFNDTVPDFPLYRVRGSDRPGTCYYECEYGYDDCDGNPNNGCEVKVSACVNGINSKVGWDWELKKASDGCEMALGYTKAELGLDPSYNGPVWFSCEELRNNPTVNATGMPLYCAGGQDGLPATGRCVFTCNAGFEDCDGDPSTGCEKRVSDNSCGCVDCKSLPGTLSEGLSGTNEFVISQSTCNNATIATTQCTLPCDETLCKDVDEIWENGCEVAMAYPDPRNSTAIGQFDCSIWSKDYLLAKKQHISNQLLGEIYCEGRFDAAEPGTCSFQGACMNPGVGALHFWQDCNSDPRDGCEDNGRWCTFGLTETEAPRETQSDRCSKAQKYVCDFEGFNALDQLCADHVTGFILEFPGTIEPDFDCYYLFSNSSLYNVDTSVVVPYCDRDATHIKTRGDCVFKCLVGYADCDRIASTGCEAPISALRTCDYDCINCRTLSGRDLSGDQPQCIDDPLNAGRKICDFNCTVGSCEDSDGNWRNGCEVAKNKDRDNLGIFMNVGDDMDCSVMQEEVFRNPEFFVHHLHIDLTKKVVTTIETLPGGSIFCNNGLILNSVTEFGHCHFECVPGFHNFNGLSQDGCELPHPTIEYPYTYGGYLIGNYQDEKYLEFLCALDNLAITNSNDNDNVVYLKVPTNVCYSLERLGGFNPAPVIWY